MFDNVLAQFGLEGGKALIDVRNGAGDVVGVMRANGKSGPFGMGQMAVYRFSISRRRGGNVFGDKLGRFLDEDDVKGVFTCF